MAMTCAELRHDLAILTELIAAIHRDDEFDASDAKDLRWASAEFQALSAVLETRRMLQGQKVVSLALWCCGREQAALETRRGKAKTRRTAARNRRNPKG